MPEMSKGNLIAAVIVVVLIWLLLAASEAANAQIYCKVWQHGTVELQTSAKQTQYIIPVEYDAPFCGDVTMFVTEQGVDTGLALATFSAQSTRSEGVLQIEINDRVPPDGIVVIGWMGVSDDGQ